MKADPKCPCCELDRKAGLDMECVHFAKPFVRVIGGKFHAMIDPCDGRPALVRREAHSTFQEASDFAADEAKKMTDAVWAMVGAGPQAISKGGRV